LYQNGIYKMVLVTRAFTLNLLVFTCLLFSALAFSEAFIDETINDARLNDKNTSNKSPDEKALAQYDALKELQNINTDANRRFVKSLLSEVSEPRYKNLQAPIYAYIARLKVNDGNWHDGKNYLEVAIARLDFVEDNTLLFESLENISWIYFIRGNYSDAILYIQKMTELAYSTDDMSGQITALNRLALSYIELELFELAINPLKKALVLARKNKDVDNEFLAVLYLINAQLNVDNVDAQETLALTLVAEDIPSTLNNNDGYLARLKGLVNQQIGDNDKAEQWFTLAEKKAKINHDVRLLQMVSKNLSELYLASNKPLLALDYAIATLEYNNQMGHKNTRAAIHYLLSDIYQQLNDDKNSLKYLRAYTEYQHSQNDKDTISLITTMDKRLDDIKRSQKMAELDNALLTNKVMAQENENKQQFFIFIIIALLLIFCSFIVAFVIHHRMLKAQLVLSMKDELTGIYCRNYLKDYLPAVQSRFERETNEDLSLGVLILDCDDFKFINDTFGHAGGDKALKAIVDTINGQIREQDLLLRWGGDEFVVICESVSQSQMREFAKRIIASIGDMLIEYEEATLLVTISAGFALHDKAEAFDFYGLIKVADELLLATKKSGKNNYLGNQRNNLITGNFSTW